MLAPDVVRRADRFAAPPGTALEVRGPGAVADETKVFAERVRAAEVALVDGVPGVVVAPLGQLFAVLRVAVERGGSPRASYLPDEAAFMPRDQPDIS